jgi:hypothetical protein
MSTDLSFSVTDIPSGETENSSPDTSQDATPDAPYGYTATGRVRKRPVGSRNATPSSGKRNDKLAADAAAILVTANGLVAISLMAFGMPMTAGAIQEANATFETMAREALANDPALCRKILSAGATGGKTALLLAYGMLASQVGPAAFMELRARRALAAEEDENNG